LVDNLEKEGHADLAKNALRKYMEVMPDLNPTSDAIIRKFYLTEAAYKVNEKGVADKLINQVHKYVTNTLNYNYTLYQDGKIDVKNSDLQLSMSLLNGLLPLSQKNNPALYKQVTQDLKNYEQKFGVSSGQ
jgi:hypothetical protein